jgi:hypothetical protein
VFQKEWFLMSESIIESTKAKVKNVQAVEEVLDRYWHEFDPEIEDDDGSASGSLTLSGYDAFPQAVSEADWPADDEYPDDHAWESAVEDLLWKLGDEGFVALLQDLAPYLGTPLTVVWHWTGSGEFLGAGQWTVWPGSPYVQVHEVVPLHKDRPQEAA